MDRLVGLRTDLAIDAGAVGDGITSLERLDQPVLVADANLDEGHPGHGKDFLGPWPPVDPSGQQDGLVAVRRQRFGEVAADESRTSSDRYSHDGG